MSASTLTQYQLSASREASLLGVHHLKMNTYKNICRTEKVATFRDHMDLPIAGWTDHTEWPDLDRFGREGVDILGMKLQMEVDPRDETTGKALDSFRNKFVEQNCHKDAEIRYSLA